MNVEFWGGFIAALLILGGVVYALARGGRLPMAANGRESTMTRLALERQVNELASTVKVLQQDHVRDMQRIGQMEIELANAKERIKYLEGQLSQYQTERPDAESAARAPDFPLLAIFGPDDAITQADEGALNQAGIAFKAIYRATRELVAAELARRRRSNDLYLWLHIATHAGPEGLLLTGETAAREWWNKQLAGVTGVFLAGCTDVAVADWLIGVVGWVLSFTVEIDNEQARQFALVFWTAIAEGKGPRDGYRAACKAVPTLAKVSDFRAKG